MKKKKFIAQTCGINYYYKPSKLKFEKPLPVPTVYDTREAIK